MPRLLFFRYGRTAGLCGLLALASCMATPQTTSLLESATDGASRVELESVAFFPQRRYQCGPAALATVLRHGGVASVTADSLVSRVYIPARQGSLQVEMLAAARHEGRIPVRIPEQLDAILREVRDGRPVLVFQNLGLDHLPRWHYAVVIGFDLAAETLILRSGTDRRRVTPLRVFERTWARADHWAAVLVEPGVVPASARPLDYVQAVQDFSAVHEAGIAAAWQAGAGRWPEEPLVQLAHANQLHAAGHFARAAGVLRDLLDFHPEHADTHNNLAHALLRDGRPREALLHAREAVRIGGVRADRYRDTLHAVRQSLQ